MILGVGLDVVETQRIARALALHGGRFEERVYTAAELAACADRADRAQALAGRFAAKEALLKALGTGSARGISFQQVEVVRDRKSTRLNSSHVRISYAVFCLKKKKTS